MYFVEALTSTATSVAMYIGIRFLFTKFITKESFSIFSLKDIGTIFVFAGILFPINYYWVESPQEKLDKQVVQPAVNSGQSFTAPELAAVQKPLNIDVVVDDEQKIDAVTTEIETKLAKYVFSSHGASLESVNLLWQNGAMLVPVVTAELPSCILGFSQPAPLQYALHESYRDEQSNTHVVVYQAKLEHGFVYKKFVIHDATYQIDVVVTFEKISEPQQVRLFVSQPSLTEEVKAIVNKAGSDSRFKIQDIALNKDQNFHEFWFEPKFFGFTTKFLATVCFAANNNAVGRAYLKKQNNDQFQYILESKEVCENNEISWSLYVGPKTTQDLAVVDKDLVNLMQYGWLTPVTKPVLFVLTYLYEKTGSYGWAIILLTLLIKLMLLPFTLKSERSLKQQAEFDKKRAYLQQKFKYDKAALDQAMAELINKHGFPMLSGCLPMLMNFPIFLALNKVLSSSILLHGASFAWLPDLSAVDPYYILSIMVFAAMVASPMPSTDPRQWFSRIGFALFLSAVTSYLASGLAMFIMMNTVLGVVQTQVTRKIKWLQQ